VDQDIKGVPTSRSPRSRSPRKAAASTAAPPAASPSSAGAPAADAPAANPPLPLPELAEVLKPLQSFSGGLAETLQAVAGLHIAPDRLLQIQREYAEEAGKLWNQALQQPQQAFAPKDRRFAGEAWGRDPLAGFSAAQYLLNARTLLSLADAVQGDEKTRARVRFGVQQWVDAMSPANYLALNPEAQRKALDSGGESIAQGLKRLVDDIRQGHLSQTDETAFEVGRNVATSEGAVVYENELFQLLEYKPLTPQVHETPMLFVPPCINKFYILDLQPDNSLIRYTVEQGHRTFVVSWRNPDDSLAGKTWDDYVEDGVIRALRVVQSISGRQRVDTLGFCIGGTLLATALAVLAGHGEQPAASLTLLTSFLDFSDTGVLDLFVDEPAVRLREMTLGSEAPGGAQLLQGRELATTFSFLRPNELVWNYVVGNYLKGETPPPFDLLYWNSDSTNLPGPMYCWYLRNTYLENRLKDPGAVTVCGVPVDFGLIEAPTYLYASREDHIVPWQSAYLSTKLLKGPVRFMLGASGHIAGVINPAKKNKRSHWIGADGAYPDSAEDWLAASTEHPGSWWTDWSAWLATHAGPKQAAPKVLGSPQYPVIEPAPGRYVKQKV
jgi:polyhydroxyalkanoate synthase